MPEESDEELELRYRTLMRVHQVKFVDLTINGEYAHACKSVIENVVDPRAPKAKRLMREVGQLQVRYPSIKEVPHILR